MIDITSTRYLSIMILMLLGLVTIWHNEVERDRDAVLPLATLILALLIAATALLIYRWMLFIA